LDFQQTETWEIPRFIQTLYDLKLVIFAIQLVQRYSRRCLPPFLGFHSLEGQESSPTLLS